MKCQGGVHVSLKQNVWPHNYHMLN